MMYQLNAARASRTWVLLAVAALLWSGLTVQSLGQTTSTLTGIVVDQTKGVIPGAEITLIDESSGDTRKTVANDEGYFTVTALMPKTYKLSIQMPGFQTWIRVGIVMHPGDKIHIDNIVLVPGEPSTVITVTEQAGSLVTLDSGERSSVLTSTQIQNTSIVGRDATELLKLLPGMSMRGAGDGFSNRANFTGEYVGINGTGANGAQSAVGSYSANGGRLNAIDITSDGTHVSDPGCNCGTPVNPNVDMIQEMKVQGATFAAENSKGPVVISTVSKAGGAQYHGSAYYYGRRPELNSNDWENNASGQAKPQTRFGFPGFNIGGPVRLPFTGFNKNRDKAFFFFGSEWMRQQVDTGLQRNVVPYPEWLEGDFSDTAKLAAVGKAKFPLGLQPNQNGFVNGKLANPSLIDPGMRAIMKLYPKPNRDPLTNDGYNWTDLIVLNQNMQQQLARVDYSLSENAKLYVRYNRQREVQPFAYGLWWNSSEVPTPSRIVASNASDSVSTNLVNVLSASMTNEFTFGYTYVNFPNRFEEPEKASRKALGYTHKGIYKNETDQIPNITSWGGAARMHAGQGGLNPEVFATKQLLSLGDNFTKVFSTHTMKTGVFVETVLHKQQASGNDNGQLEMNMWSSSSSGNEYADMLLGRGNWSEQTANLVNDTYYNIVEAYVQDSWKVTQKATLEYGVRLSHLGPWTGRGDVAYQIFDPARYSNDPADLIKYTGGVDYFSDSSVPKSGRTVKRLLFGPRLGGAYALSDRTTLRGGFGVFNFHDEQIDEGLNQAPRTLSTFVPSTDLNTVDTLLPERTKTSLTAIDRYDDRNPVTYNWNFTISQKLPRTMVLEASYVGNHSRNLIYNRPLNVVPEGKALVPIGTDVNWDDYRPYRNYSTISISEHSDTQNYNSLQMMLLKQTGRLNYSAAYTFGKTLGYRGSSSSGSGVGNNAFDRRHRDYGVLGYDRTHVMTVAYSYLVPDLFQGNRLFGAVVNGWQFTGISTWQSGLNLGALTGNFNISVRDAENRGVGQPHITGTDGTSIQPILTCDPRKGLGPHEYVNGACFAPPSPGQNGMFQFPYMRGPAYMNHDLSTYKNFQIGKNEAHKLQVRFSANNFLNHALDSFGTSSRLDMTFTNGVLQNPEIFGTTNRKAGKRVCQFAIKYMF